MVLSEFGVFLWERPEGRRGRGGRSGNFTFCLVADMNN